MPSLQFLFILFVWGGGGHPIQPVMSVEQAEDVKRRHSNHDIDLLRPHQRDASDAPLCHLTRGEIKIVLHIADIDTKVALLCSLFTVPSGESNFISLAWSLPYVAYLTRALVCSKPLGQYFMNKYSYHPKVIGWTKYM